MLRIGLTGGIGTGKSTIAHFLEILDIPVLYADDIAKQLMHTDVSLQSQLTQHFGSDIFEQGTLQRERLAQIVFGNEKKRNLLNNIVHPAVKSYTEQWFAEQKQHLYAVKEAAILFEAKAHLSLDLVIGVAAPLEIRIARTMHRDKTDAPTVEKKIAAQMDNEEKMALCDYVIYNDDVQSVIAQTLEVHHKILQLAASK